MNRKTLLIIVAAAVIVLAVAGFISFKKLHQTPLEPPHQTTANTDNSAPKESFIDIVPVTYHVDKLREFPIPDGEAFNPRVSPDGAKIVFVRKIGGKDAIDIADLASGRIFNLSIPLDEMADPSWNADGSKIVFAGARQKNWEIYLFDLKDKKLLPVTNDPKRKKSQPRCSPFTFDGNHRIAYVSEVNGRKDIWWVRESGDHDQAITVAANRVKKFENNPLWKEFDQEAPSPVTTGGDAPEWSPSGNLLLYRTAKGYSMLAYSYQSWWHKSGIPLPTATNSILSWAPNQTAFLEFKPALNAAAIISRNSLKQKKAVLANRSLSSAPSYFPDGRGFAYIINNNGRSTLAIEPYDDPLGDVANLWMFPYSQMQKRKLTDNQMLLMTTRHDQIYTLYDSERYGNGSDEETGLHARPYLVTSDAVLETFYSAFTALYATVEREELKNALEEFSREGARVAREKRVSKDVETLFLTGLLLLKPENASVATPEAREEAARVQAATGKMHSLFNFDDKVDYGDFFIRGKYERDKDLQGYFRAIKWFQTFTFNLGKEDERRFATEILAVSNSPKVRPSLERIYALYRDMVGESRYLNPTNIKEIPATGQPSSNSSGLPWIETQGSFRLMPSIYTVDAFIFDELIFHDRPDTVGTPELRRMLPKGLDIMAAFGSNEARGILVNELQEGRFYNYEAKLAKVTDKIRRFPRTAWEASLYQNWLDSLASLVREPPPAAPAFTRTKAWKRKQLNTALGSWVNLRYETIAVVEQVSAAECGEGGYEMLEVGRPRGYVEPNPEFFHRLDAGFGKLSVQMERAVRDPELRKGVTAKIAGYRKQLQGLEIMARKELEGKPLSDEEYTEIYNIGGTIEHFIMLMGSLNNKGGDQGEDSAIGTPDPIRKIVDVQKHPDTGERLYEALGHVSEINVAVPYYGRRTIVKGPVYSYHEFTSAENLDSAKWRASGRQPPPTWLRPYYEGKGGAGSGTLSDVK